MKVYEGNNSWKHKRSERYMYSELQRCHAGFEDLLFHFKFRPSWYSIPGHNSLRVLLPFSVPIFVELSTFGLVG